MNTTRIPAWFLLLTIGLILATAVTALQTRVLANPRLSLDTAAQSEDEINDKNWQNNSRIVAIRKMVNAG